MVFVSDLSEGYYTARRPVVIRRVRGRSVRPDRYEDDAEMAAKLYLVKAQLISGLEAELLAALEAGQVAPNSIYEQEMQQALRLAKLDGHIVRWITGCNCASPLAAERQDLEQFLIIRRTQVLDGSRPRPQLPGVPLREGLRAILASGPKLMPYGPRG